MLAQPQCPGRPWAVQWRIDGARKTRGFRTRTLQEAFASSLAGGLRSAGIDALRMDEDEARQWRAFRARIGDVPLDDVLAHWESAKSTKRVGITLAVATEKFLATRRAAGLAESTLSHYRTIYDRLVAAHGNECAGAISSEVLARWIENSSADQWTRRTHFARLRSLYRWLVRQRLVALSPVEAIEPQRIVHEEVAVITPADCRKLLGDPENLTNRELCGRLALEAFAGLRFSSAARIAAADIDFAARGITLPAAKIKTRRRHYIEGLEENLWKWLEWSEPKKWAMTQRDYMREKSLAFVRSKTPHPKNCLRHSAATYHVALYRDPSRTSLMLCHSSPKMLWSHYKGRGTKSDGESWFQILPP